jgi:hypothetical protein
LTKNIWQLNKLCVISTYDLTHRRFYEINFIATNGL